MSVAGHGVLRRSIQYFFFRAGNFQRAIFLTRIISAIDRFSIRHFELLVSFGASVSKAASSSPRRIRPVADRRTPKPRKLSGRKVRVDSCLTLF